MQALTAFQVVGALAGGASDSAQAMNEAARAESEARLAETQALQRDTAARGDLDRFLATVSAARAANGLSSTSPNAQVLRGEATEVMDRERLIQRADDRQRAANFRAAAKAYRKTAKLSLVTGVGAAAVPLGQYGAYKGWW